ncbi:hypothetical protein [Kitasatospora purpeofusca]|uniref:hypothetical protein n=1 Tax=Kitasatospora purpeofusca TaxID=67352 RepID=UPI000AD7158B|nr:hypothetical protein [Kitasatospora purpeofusca]MCX4752982.1 hypothetical protein [Kitasatospora purpeofusca]WSR32518.1 hypothetical protein OG715_16920 [Kitasatospora purpeofusca]WSR40608.1 hypothetical protein OG196_16715 [Kitasatospora purpeofusca]
MPQSIARPTMLAVAGLIAILPLSAVSCSAAQKALDCGNTAVKITGDINEVSNAYSNASNDSAAAGQALQKLKNDLDQLGKNSKDTDVVQAINDLNTQVDKVQQAVNNKQVPDFKPLGSAASNLTKVCTG